MVGRRLVVLPTYQEAENIEVVLRQIGEASPGTDILVVDDASPDRTADRAERLGAHVLRRTGKRGLGPAYADGFAWGLERGYEVFVGMDADLSHDPAVLPTLVGLVEDGADMAIGSRYVDGGAIPDWPAHRRALSRWGNRYATLALRLPVNDATSGYRAFSAEILRRIHASSLRASGYGFLIELVYRVARAGGRIAETPIVFVDRQRGDSKMNSRIVAEAMLFVTLWGMRDRLVRRAPWLLAAVTFVACMAFRPRYPTDWDSIQLVLGVDRFDVTGYSPHPPGYWLYIFLGRVVRFLTPFDASTSLTVLSAAAAGAAVGLTYEVGRRWAGPWLGWAAAAFLMTSPFLLFFGALPSTYTFDALLAVVLVLLASQARRGSPHAWVAAGVLGLGGGLRQTMLLLLGPVVLVAAVASVRSVRGALAVVGAGAGGIAAWALPMLLEQPGGWTRYRAFSDRFLDDTLIRTSILRRAPRVDILNNLGQATGHTVAAVLVLLPVVLVGLALCVVARRRERTAPRHALLLWLCVLASLAFVIVVHFGKSGYVLSYLPALGLLLLWPASRLRARPQAVATVLVAVACLVDFQRFASATGILPGRWVGRPSAWFTQRLYGAPYRVTRSLMRETDDITTAYLALGREFDPRTDALVYVIGNGGQWFRHSGYTLPGFTSHYVHAGVRRLGYQRNRVSLPADDRVVPVPVGGRAVFVIREPGPEALQLAAEGRVTAHRLRTGPVVWVAPPGVAMFGVTVTADEGAES